MKKNLLAVIIFTFMGCSDTEKQTGQQEQETKMEASAEPEAVTAPESKYSSELNGTWVPVSQEFNGNILPAEKFSKQKLELMDTTYTLTAESVDRGTVKYFGNQMDIYGKEGVNQGKHFKAIYKVENDLLYVCYDLTGQNYPGEFTTAKTKTVFLSVFKRQ